MDMVNSSTASPEAFPSSRSDPGDPPPYYLLNADGSAPLILVCDHASNAIPRHMNDLGLGHQELARHIAWDIGAAEVTRRLADRFDAPAVLSGYSRLVIDCNRAPGGPDSIAKISDGVIIPGNQEVGDEEAEWRLENCFWPYHHTITGTLAHLWRHGLAPALVSIHSFTPRMNGFARPWHIGILWNRDPRLASPILEWLRAHPSLCVGDNEPYSGRDVGFTLERHAGAAGLPHLEFEIRQDLLADEEGCRRWAQIAGDALTAVLANRSVHQVVHY